MTKTRSFSIYLLKEGFDETNALREDHPLDAAVDAVGLPEGAIALLLDSQPHEPWWKSYFGIRNPLSQVSKGALVFLPVGGRWFALSFGHVAHNLLDTSYEYDFGLRVTLNSLDPKRLKSTDTLDPGAAKRRRTQLPIETELTFFDFDRDSTILKSLTGKVREEYKELFRHATGASNLKISTDSMAGDLPELCGNLLELYELPDYKTAFPEIQNIVPVKDPSLLEILNGRLLDAFHTRDVSLNLTVPELINYSDNVYATFSGAGAGLVYDDVYIGRYFDYLEERGVDPAAVTIDALQRHALVLTDEDGSARDRFTIFKSLVFDTSLAGRDGETFHLCEGQWYQIDNEYIRRLTAYLDPLFVAASLPAYNHTSEGDYNAAVPGIDPNCICLDKTNISPEGQTAIEPCDLIALRDGTLTLFHIKVSTLSAQLSHLFNQGVNSLELLRLENDAVNNLERLVRERAGTNDLEILARAVQDKRYRVVFGIVSRKDPAGLSANLPLFSRISLMRSMKSLHVMNVTGQVEFIMDQSAGAEGRKKKRKPRVVRPVIEADDLELA